MDMRLCSTCGYEYDALQEPNGHKCRVDQLQRAALAAYDCGKMDEYERLNRVIAAKIVGAHTSEAKRIASRENGKSGGRPKIQRLAYIPPTDPKQPHCPQCGEQENIQIKGGKFASCNECG